MTDSSAILFSYFSGDEWKMKKLLFGGLVTETKKPSIHGWMNAWAAVPLQVRERKAQWSMTASLLNMLAKCTRRYHVFWLLNQTEVEVMWVWEFPQEKI